MPHDKSKVVSTQLAWGQFVQRTLSAHGADVITELSASLGGTHASYRSSALRERFRTYEALIAQANEELERAEAYYVSEHNGDADTGNARDVSMAHVDATIDRLRRTFAGICEPRWLMTFGLEAPPPRDAAGMMAYGKKVVMTLRQQGSLEDTFDREVSLTPFADALVVPLNELEHACAQTREETRELQRALQGRHQAQETWKLTYRHIAGVLAAEFDRAGHHDLARMLRPTIRRITGIEHPSATDQPDMPEV